LKEPNFFY